MHIKKFSDWSGLSKATAIVSGVCLLVSLLALIWHGFADFYTSHIYIWISVPIAWFSSVMPFSLIGWLSVWRIPLLCIICALFGIALFVFRKHNTLVLKIGVPIVFVSTVLFLLSLIGSAFYDTASYTVPFFVACGVSLVFIVFVAILNSHLSPEIWKVWFKTGEITLITAVSILVFLCLIPVLTTTITDQHQKQDVTYSQADMVNYGLSCLDDMEVAYHEMIAICGSPDKVKFPVYDELKNDLIAAMRSASDTFPSLKGYYPDVRFYSPNNPIFTGNIVGLFVPGTEEILIKNNLRNSEYPSVIAHEYAHLKGFLRESEADYISDYVCINSDNPWIRYSGYYNIFSRMLSVLRSLQNTQDYNVLVLRYNKMFNDAKGVLYLTPDEGSIADYVDSFQPGELESLSADLTIELTIPAEQYASVRERLLKDSLSHISWNISVTEANRYSLDSLLCDMTIQASLGELLMTEVGPAVFDDLNQLLEEFRTSYGERADWSLSVRRALGFSPEEYLDQLKTDIDSTMRTREGVQSLIVTLSLQHLFNSTDEYVPFIQSIQAQGKDLQTALQDVAEDAVSVSFSWTGSASLSEPETLNVFIHVSLPSDDVPDDLADLFQEKIPAMSTRDYCGATVTLETRKTAAELAAEEAERQKRRDQAESVFEPVGYFSFSSATSDYATSIRYLMETYLEEKEAS
ncbi:MAG: DUF3810 family protein [Clostridia bacterium]|nr:DUF3810 family protein [Clostridia bacterium]